MPFPWNIGLLALISLCIPNWVESLPSCLFISSMHVHLWGMLHKPMQFNSGRSGRQGVTNNNEGKDSQSNVTNNNEGKEQPCRTMGQGNLYIVEVESIHMQTSSGIIHKLLLWYVVMQTVFYLKLFIVQGWSQSGFVRLQENEGANNHTKEPSWDSVCTHCLACVQKC